MSMPILAIVGPTASGKTALAIDVAKRYAGEALLPFAQKVVADVPHARIHTITQNGNEEVFAEAHTSIVCGEVISADSRQVYKGFDITTCKATQEEMQGVPHHLMSFVSPTQVYTVSDFKRDADTAISEISSRNKLPIIAGGTGFYVDALLYENMFAEVPPNPALRTELETYSPDELFARIEASDPERAATVDPQNKVRLIRAVEIIEALGTVPKLPERSSRYNAVIITLVPPKELLRARIQARVESRLDAMLAEIAEARNILTPEIAARLGFDFTLCLNHLDDVLSREELIARLTAADWQLAKRQSKWFDYKS